MVTSYNLWPGNETKNSVEKHKEQEAQLKLGVANRTAL